MKIQKLWALFFSVWLLLLTGLLHPWINSPGLQQWLEIRHVLQEQSQEIKTIEVESARMSGVIRQLETNPVAQEREVRKILGYVDESEIVFDFE